MPKFKKPPYTQIPNELLDEMMPTLTGSQFKILCLIARRTLGYHRDCHAMTISQIAEGTGISYDGATDSIGYLCDKEYIKRNREMAGKRYLNATYRLNIEGEEDDVDIGKIPTSDQDSMSEKFLHQTDSMSEKFLDHNKEVKKNTFKEKDGEANPPSNPPRALPENHPTLDIEPETGEGAGQSQRKFWNRGKKPPKPPNPFGGVEALRRLREGNANAEALPARPAADGPQVAVRGTPPPQPVVGQKSWPERWNELVPQGAVNPYYFPKEAAAYSSPGFADQFEAICAKAVTLMEKRDWITFPFLIKFYPDTGQFGWQKMMSGQYDNIRYQPRRDKDKETQEMIARIVAKDEQEKREHREIWGDEEEED